MRTSLVHRSSLREQLMEALRDELVTGRMPPGRHYTAREIADHYGVSATPVREAMVQLAAEGLLEASHLRGFAVRRVEREEFDAILAARDAVLRGQLVQLDGGLPEVAADPLASVRRRAQAARDAAQGGRLDVIVVSDLRFWREFAGLFGNQHLSRFLAGLRSQAWLHMVPRLRGRGDLAGLYWQRQPELVSVFGSGDADGVQELLGDYRRSVVEIADRYATIVNQPATGGSSHGV
ncbi:hypothetical protein BIV57_15680 [Mangrovactinospora gilvigrisea]|uniref:HTH gntR-type domain-containing protein n=1 Tax=Mangrovactinospora gilvigrisea TaxID=1428644 RepID=A0A1J7BD38_9ACTN|nr:GntR family transcriptional regulator [Mangrovactinospora gilvigrisea]OIV36591.1 hypothetical protein BIV57_15680 [Mangrovactinospora gilvigrisea]